MTWLPVDRSLLASTLKIALFPEPRFPRMIVLALERTRWNTADATKYFSSPRPMSSSADGAPKSRPRMIFGDHLHPANPRPFPQSAPPAWHGRKGQSTA